MRLGRPFLQRRRDPETEEPRLLAQFELLRDRVITISIRAMQVIEQATALSYHDQETAAGAVVFLVSLQVLGKRVDTLGQKSDLDVSRSCVTFMQTKFIDDISFSFHISNFFNVQLKPQDRWKNRAVKEFFLP
jgi:hypothetical protein